MILFFDTETTGKADFRASPDAPHQPHVVQLAAILTDDVGKEMASINLLIKPDGYDIPVEASDIHGITTEMATQFGVDKIAATHVFDQLLMRARLAVAHNVEFDTLVIARGSKTRHEWLLSNRFCTMRAMTDVCKLPGAYGFKWPKLQEAHVHAFGLAFEDEHDAMADVRACRDVYFWLAKEKAAA